MCEVTKYNFNELYPMIEKSLKKAALIGIDSEFSGLVLHSKLKNSLFDSSSDRYLKLKCSVEQFTVFQFGLSIFHYNRDSNKYIADVYCFYTFPRSFGSVDPRFLCQASSWEFLGAHKFNFNKVVYEGVPFLSDVQEHLIREQLGAGTTFSNVERSLSYREEDELQAQCSHIAQWLTLAKVGDTMDIKVSATDYCLRYFLHKEIRSRFRDVWSFQSPEKITVQKMKIDDIQKLYEDEGDQLEEELVDSLMGFSKVFKLLVALKKPIVGHNLLLDLMILYSQMFKPLPSTYATFKKQLNAMFPSIFDTKLISYRVRDLVNKQDRWESNRLDHLFVYFNTSKGKSLASFSPTIEVVDDESYQVERVEEHLHEAAWDAYMSGYCFIRLAHFLAIRRLGEDAIPRPLSRTEHLSAVSTYRNCVNVIRGSVTHMNIGGEEPPSTRPKLLYLTRRDGQAMNIDLVTLMLAPYGSLDVKALSPSCALIAVSNKPTARQIVTAFIGDKQYKVVPYSYLRHSTSLSTILRACMFLSGGLCIAALIISTTHR